jgi:hypothetical protein
MADRWTTGWRVNFCRDRVWEGLNDPWEEVAQRPLLDSFIALPAVRSDAAWRPKQNTWEVILKKSVFAAAFAALLTSTSAFAQMDELKIMAPAAPGGGWDQTARSIQSVLQAEGLASNIQVENVAGAGGTIGLQQFVNRSAGDPTATIVGGYVMVGAIIANAAPVTPV